MCRLAVEVRWLAVKLGYWLRPFDMLADGRRWRWQERAVCGLPAMTDEAAARLRAVLVEAITEVAPVVECDRADAEWCVADAVADLDGGNGVWAWTRTFEDAGRALRAITEMRFHSSTPENALYSLPACGLGVFPVASCGEVIRDA